ncbi:MAG: HAMP domain-containing histidine kinase [Deltaproteobacteria bacterium]|nr:HAMP domain-containing histidine kinase [Deltaproteobacteria bacterium]
MRPRFTWLLFVTSLMVVLGVMAWVTGQLLHLEDEFERGRIQVEREERVRLALWRMDSALMPLLAQESALAGLPPDGSGLPRGVRARFARDSSGGLTLWADSSDVSSDDLGRALGDIDRRGLDLTASADETLSRTPATSEDAGTPPDDGEDRPSQSYRNSLEWSQRATVVKDTISAYESAFNYDTKSGLGRARPRGISGVPVVPLWLGSELVLVRSRPNGEGLEGSWLDWAALQADLRERIVDLLPDAELVSAAADVELGADRHLATLPIRLVAGDPPRDPAPWSPLRVSLTVGWVFVLLASAAVAGLLYAALGLSERRAAFVSTVTHELRTPLTTFRMYTEMLEADMVPDKRMRYLATLRREAERLGHLVENVLAFARIESRHRKVETAVVSVGRLIEGVRERLQQRCVAGGVALEIDLTTATDALALVDEAAVEQILFNLIDNATKYGGNGPGAEVVLCAQVTHTAVELHVRDQGPGVPATEVRRIFEAFAKGSAHATGTQPGVGLGLALSRRLARQMGGDLGLVEAGPGADFVLTLTRG